MHLAPILLNADKPRGSESPQTLGMFTKGGSQGGKDRRQFRFLRRQSFSTEFADAIFQSPMHGQGEPECRQSSTFAMIVRYHTYCIFVSRQPSIGRPPGATGVFRERKLYLAEKYGRKRERERVRTSWEEMSFPRLHHERVQPASESLMVRHQAPNCPFGVSSGAWMQSTCWSESRH